MYILLKLIKENIVRKKFRTLLIIIIISTCTALIFNSLAISNTLKYMYMKQMRESLGNADIEVSAPQNSASQFFGVKDDRFYGTKMDYAIGVVEGQGYINNGNNLSEINLLAIKINELQKMNPAQYEEKLKGENFQGNFIVVSRSMAQKYNLKIGSTLPITINKNQYNFNVWAIVDNAGFFSDTMKPVVVMPRETLCSIFKIDRQVSKLYCKIKNSDEKQLVMGKLYSLYPNFNIREVITSEEVKDYISRTSSSFMEISIIVMFLCVFIIYTTFKVILLERINLVGTLRSIGATKINSSMVLFLESLIYGIVGGIVGIGIGIVLLSLISKNLNSSYIKSYEGCVSFGINEILISIFSAILISIISSIISFIGIFKVSIKSILVDSPSNVKSTKGVFSLIGILTILICITLPRIIYNKNSFNIDLIASIGILVGSIFIVQLIISIYSFISKPLYHYIFKNEGILAVKNIKSNKYLINNIILLVIGISCMYVINSTGESVMHSVTDYYNNLTYDIDMHVDKGDQFIENSLCNSDGISGVMGIYEFNNVKITNTNSYINMIRGVNPEKVLQYNNLTNLSVNPSELNKGRNIIITNTLKNALNIKLGDIITLQTNFGNMDYKIIGFFDSIEYYGSVAFISEDNAKLDMHQYYYTAFEIKTLKPSEKVKTMLLAKYRNIQPQISTKNELERNNVESNINKIKILKYFSFIALGIGAIGVFSNFIIGFVERKKILAIIVAIGMSKNQLIKMLFVESLSCGILGGTIGSAIGIAIASIIPYILRIKGFIIQLNFSLNLILACIISGIFISIITSFGPIIEGRKMSVIEIIKYE